MAIRKRNTPTPYQVYWNNPVTGERESKAFANEWDAEKFNAEIRYRLKYEKSSFAPAEPTPENSKLTLEHLYLLYLKDKAFAEKDLARHLSNMKPILEALGGYPVEDINKQHLLNVLNIIKNCKKNDKTLVSATTVRNRLSILKTIA